jgi:hypothetical protein
VIMYAKYPMIKIIFERRTVSPASYRSANIIHSPTKHLGSGHGSASRIGAKGRHGFFSERILVALTAGTGGNLRELSYKLLIKQRISRQSDLYPKHCF